MNCNINTLQNFLTRKTTKKLEKLEKLQTTKNYKNFFFDLKNTMIR